MNVNHLMVYYAQCNRHINKAMLDLVEKHVESPLTRPLEGYHFKTVGQLLEHVFVADMNWLKAFSDLESYGLSLASEVRAVPAYGQKVFTDFADYRAARVLLDDFLVRYMELVDDRLFRQKVSRKLRNGVLLERSADLALVHFFNHQTHHRGQISALLDQLGVENDYSNMIFLEF